MEGKDEGMSPGKDETETVSTVSKYRMREYTTQSNREQNPHTPLHGSQLWDVLRKIFTVHCESKTYRDSKRHQTQLPPYFIGKIP